MYATRAQHRAYIGLKCGACNADGDNLTAVVILGDRAVFAITHIRKLLKKDKSLMSAFQALPFMANPELYNGKTLWSDENLRVDFAHNQPGSNAIYINWQRNRDCKLEGLKHISTHTKIFTQVVTVGIELSEKEISESVLEGFSQSGTK